MNDYRIRKDGVIRVSSDCVVSLQVPGLESHCYELGFFSLLNNPRLQLDSKSIFQVNKKLVPGNSMNKKRDL